MVAGLLLASMVGAASSIADGPGTQESPPAAGGSVRQVTGQPDTGSSITVPGAGPPTDLTGVSPVGPDDKHPKLESPLATVARIAREQGVDAAVAEAQARGLHTAGDRVRVVVVGADNDAGAARTVAASLGGTVESSYESLSQVLFSVASLDQLAAAPEVQSIRAPIVARPAGEPPVDAGPCSPGQSASLALPASPALAVSTDTPPTCPPS